jgi:hypothetical protein
VILLSLSPSFSHHVVFEEIGKMAGTLSYIHAIVPINISLLALTIRNFRLDVHALRTLYTEQRQPTGTNYDEWFHQRIADLFDLAAADTESMLADTDSLCDSLPPVAAETHLPHEDHDYRVRLLSPFAIVSGVIGTLMGWFMQRRLNNLRNRRYEVQNQQNHLLHVQAIQMQLLDEIDSAVKQFYKAIQTGHTAWISYSSLDHAHSQLRFNLQKLIRALQAAQHRRLSMDLLPSHKLKKLFDAAARKARSHHYELLLRHPSDLLQIKTSYLHDGHDVHLILHIPMAPSDLLLRLFQLRPFPLPFTEMHMLLPAPAHQILAANSDQLSVELSAVYLLGCHRVNQVYLC